MFTSVPATWHGVMTDTADVKELVPEMYCCPEALVNASEYVPRATARTNMGSHFCDKMGGK